MKLKLKELYDMFQEGITVDYIYENLICCNSEIENYVEKAIKLMEEKHFEVLGLKEGGKISKYITKNGEKNMIQISEVVANTTSIMDMLFIMKDYERLFILSGNQIKGIVTRADLLKIPVRLLIFGLINTFEILCSQAIKIYCPNDEWKKCLSNSRLSKANDFLNDRKARNEDLSLLDCLQFCDKMDIISECKTFSEIFTKVNIISRNQRDEFLDEIEKLRDKMAHAQDITIGTSWDKIINIIQKVNMVSIELEGLISKSSEPNSTS